MNLQLGIENWDIQGAYSAVDRIKLLLRLIDKGLDWWRGAANYLNIFNFAQSAFRGF